MKKLLPVILVAVAAGGIWFVMQEQPDLVSDNTQVAKNNAPTPTNNKQGSQEVFNGSSGSSLDSEGTDSTKTEQDDDDAYEKDAIELYSSVDQAFAALEQGAISYDDVILDQFVEPDESCTWCDELYGRIKTALKSDTTLDEDKKSYFGEILAISGRKENIQELVRLVGESKGEDAEIFAESLEFTIGNDDVVAYMESELKTENELLKESLVAGITNQSSLYAAEILYRVEQESEDPDENYDVGIGLGEFIPDEEALPFLQDKMNVRDGRSHLAAKALLNHGRDGLALVFDVLTKSDSPDFDKKMLEDAADHVIYEDGIEKLLNDTIAQSNTPTVVAFAKEILESFREEGEIPDDAEE